MNKHVYLLCQKPKTIAQCWNRWWSRRHIRIRCRMERRNHIRRRSRMRRCRCKRWLDGMVVSHCWDDCSVGAIGCSGGKRRWLASIWVWRVASSSWTETGTGGIAAGRGKIERTSWPRPIDGKRYDPTGGRWSGKLVLAQHHLRQRKGANFKASAVIGSQRQLLSVRKNKQRSKLFSLVFFVLNFLAIYINLFIFTIIENILSHHRLNIHRATFGRKVALLAWPRITKTKGLFHVYHFSKLARDDVISASAFENTWLRTKYGPIRFSSSGRR